MSHKYNCLSNQIFKKNDFSLVPIRFKDRYMIMKWRNEQLYHLRQDKPINHIEQDNYFKNEIAPLFSEKKPKQILFSFLEKAKCIGYGGLVHIDWVSRNAEISFIMRSSLEDKRFINLWKDYLKLIEKVAFLELDLHKIYVYAFDLRPKLYSALTQSRFVKEATLVDHKFFGAEFIDVVIYSKIN